MALENLIYIDSTGFHYPDYADLLEYFRDQYRTIYGADVYLEPDSLDGQWLAVIAQSQYDLCAVMANIYNGFSPSVGQGDMLSRTVKINGLARRVATNSTVDVTLTGTVGTTINNGVVTDTLGQRWLLPSPTVIGGGGTVTVTATAEQVGNISAAIGTVTTISTPTRGWVSVTNSTAAVEGVAVQTDAELRRLQAVSTMLPNLAVVTGIRDAVANVEGVTRYKVYENDTNATDSDGIPAHSICAVVEGGAVQDIVDAIGLKKSGGCGTYGTTSGTYTDAKGVDSTINFQRPTASTIGVEIDITALDGYTSAFETELREAVAAYINGLDIGEDVLITRLYAPATLSGTASGLTYNLTALQIEKNGGGLGTSDITIDFDETAECDATTDIVVNVT